MSDPVATALAEYAAGVRYEGLPAEVITALKRILLDTLGTALAATTLGAGCLELIEVGASSGEECTLIGLGRKAPALPAALINGGLSHALNYDDVSSGGAGHMGVTSIPAALAAAERAGGVSGREFLAALAAGCEVMARLGAGIRAAEEGYTESKPQPTQMPGYFSCAAAAGRALGLSAAQMRSTFGLALMQCAGGRQPVLEGRPAKAIYAGFSNHGGLLSALLAKQGLEADCDAFTGEAGFFKTYHHGRYDEPSLLDGLGEQFLLLGVGFKPWPTTAVAHPFIQAALDLSVSPETIEKVHLTGGEHARTFCEPFEARCRPQSAVEAEDSVPFAVAKALANRQVSLTDLQPGLSGLDQPEALRLTSRLSYSIDPALGRSGVVEVTCTDGRTLRSRCDIAPGEAGRPMGREALVEKFLDCASHATRPVDPDSVIQIVDRLEHLTDVRDLTALL